MRRTGGNPMARILIALALGLFFSFQFVNTAHAGIRCGTDVITEGDTSVEVLSSCGEPHYVDSWVEERIKRDFYPYSSYNPPYSSSFNNDRYSNRNAYRQPFLVKENVVIERWTYSFGSNRFIHYLFFENGVLTQISQGSRGRH
jgi:Protein of unknown function (DUF2845)